MAHRVFTLIERLVVIAIIAVLKADERGTPLSDKRDR